MRKSGKNQAPGVKEPPVIQTILLWFGSAILPPLAIATLMFFQCTHKILYVLVAPVRPVFSDISQWGLTLLSFALSYPNFVNTVLLGKRKYFPPALCSLLLYVGYVGSRDARDANALKEKNFAVWINSTSQWPDEIRTKVVDALKSEKQHEFKKEDFEFSLEKAPVGKAADNRTAVILRLANGGRKSISDYTLSVSAPNCKIQSDNHKCREVSLVKVL